MSRSSANEPSLQNREDRYCRCLRVQTGYEPRPYPERIIICALNAISAGAYVLIIHGG